MRPLHGTWTGNSSYTTTFSDSVIIHRIYIGYSASITNNTTVEVDSSDGANYDELIHTFDNSAGATSNLLQFSGDELRLGTGDELKVACDVGANHAYLTVDYSIMWE